MTTLPSPAAAAPPAGRAALAWGAALALSLAALLAPALWNGYPIVFFDTGGYIKRVFDLELEPGRSLFYGLFLWASSLGWLTMWGPVLAQGLATLWLVRVALRTHGLPHGPWPLAAAAMGLSALTGISWYAAQLMPDILTGLLVLGFWLLGFRWERLGWLERAGVPLLCLLALLSHMGTVALAAGLVAVVAGAKLLVRRWGWDVTPRLLPPALVLGATLVLMPLGHLVLVGKAGFTPGGPAFVFGRLVQDGIAQKYLAEHCPDPAYKLCDYRDQIVPDANEFLWHPDSPFKKVGGWGGADAELSRITRESLKAYPGLHLRTALLATWHQILEVETGDGLDEWQEVTRWIFSGHLPWQNDAFTAARQQREQTTQGMFDALNRVHVPVAHLSLAALPFIVLWAARRKRHDVAALALFMLLALLGNAFINGALSNPHDRYQSRVAWLATLAVGMAVIAGRSGAAPSPLPGERVAR